MDQMENDIKIFVSCRIDQESTLVDNPLYVPVRCGAVFDERLLNATMIGDDTGDNISERRMTFCELTVLYWAWKNTSSDYVGLCHYRRYLSFADKEIPGIDSHVGLMDNMSEVNLRAIGILDERKMREEINKYDLIIGRKYHIKDDWIVSNTEKGVRDSWLKYCKPFITKREFEILLEGIKETYPEYYNDAREFMEGKYFLGYNCFVAKREVANDLCEFLFGVLFHIEPKIQKHGKYYSMTNKRVPGYFGEWLYSIWCYHVQKQKKYLVRENQIITFINTAPSKSCLPLSVKRPQMCIPIVLIATKWNLPEIGVTIQSILDNSNDKNYYDIIILHATYVRDFEQQSMLDSLQNMLKRQCIKYSNVNLRFFDPKDLMGDCELHFWGEDETKESYYLPLLPWLLDEYNRVLFLQDGVLIQDDLQALFETKLNNKGIAGVHDIYSLGKEENPRDDYVAMEKIYNMVETSVLVMDLLLLRKKYDFHGVEHNLLKKYGEMEKEIVFNDIYAQEIAFQDFSWNYFAFQDYFFKKMLSENVPSNVFHQFMSVKKPHILNLHVKNNVIPIWESRAYVDFWQVARRSPFYEILIRNRIVPLTGSGNVKYSVARRIADKFFPKGTKRREFLKWIIPRDSIQWRVMKRLYHFIALD